ncbi:MAG: hypothetical protein Hens3KO_00080 [Henriciella sp.]
MGKRAKPGEIIVKLREVEVRLSQGETIGRAVPTIGASEQSYYRWCKEYGGLQIGQAKHMKEIENENARLRRAVSDITLDNQILQEVVRESSKPLTQMHCSRSRGTRAWRFRTPGLPCGRPASLNAAAYTDTQSR